MARLSKPQSYSTVVLPIGACAVGKVQYPAVPALSDSLWCPAMAVGSSIVIPVRVGGRLFGGALDSTVLRNVYSTDGSLSGYCGIQSTFEAHANAMYMLCIIQGHLSTALDEESAGCCNLSLVDFFSGSAASAEDSLCSPVGVQVWDIPKPHFCHYQN
jgi:hypothetical protein